jgi:hypothetical protein
MHSLMNKGMRNGRYLRRGLYMSQTLNNCPLSDHLETELLSYIPPYIYTCKCNAKSSTRMLQRVRGNVDGGPLYGLPMFFARAHF